MMRRIVPNPLLMESAPSATCRAFFLCLLLGGLGVMCAVGSAFGQSSSTNYLVQHPSLNAGGGRSTNGVYTLDQSLGEWAPILRSDADAINIRLGFAGQLNETPIANPDYFFRAVNQSLVIPISSLLANDTDAEKDPLRLGPIASTSLKGVSLGSNATGITYQPLATLRESDAFYYTVFDSAGNASTGTVNVTITNASPVFSNIPPISIFETALAQVNFAAADPDLPDQILSYSLLAGPAGMTLNATNGDVSWTPSESDGPSTNAILVKVSDNGTPSLSATQSFVIVVREMNAPPVLPFVGPQVMTEGQSLVVTNTAADPDIPFNTVAYQLLQAPPAMIVDTNGIIRWITGEADGPSTNLVVLVVTDGGIPEMRATNSFLVIVNELNTPPALAGMTNQIINEDAIFAIALSAQDSDFPAQQLTYSLLTAPTGMVLNESSQKLIWTPSEDQGPSTNTITVKLTDDGIPALSATQSFSIVVQESNSSPQLPVLAQQTIHEGATLVVTNTATDTDLPSNNLAYALLLAPLGMTVNSNGIITWTSGEADGPSTNDVIVKVTDDGAPALSATNSFAVIVREVNSVPLLGAISNRVVKVGDALTFFVSATDADIPAQTLTYQLEPGFPLGASIESQSGQFSWTPEVSQAGQTHSILVAVTDNGSDFGSTNLTARTSFTVQVMELPPVTNLFSINKDWLFTSNSFRINWPSVVGASYRVDGKSQVNDPSWNSVSPTILATNTNSAYAIPMPNSNQFFGVASLGRISHSVLKTNQVQVTRPGIISTNSATR